MTHLSDGNAGYPSKASVLMGVGHTVSGTVKIYDDAGKKAEVLDPFSSQIGPTENLLE